MHPKANRRNEAREPRLPKKREKNKPKARSTCVDESAVSRTLRTHSRAPGRQRIYNQTENGKRKNAHTRLRGRGNFWDNEKMGDLRPNGGDFKANLQKMRPKATGEMELGRHCSPTARSTCEDESTLSRTLRTHSRAPERQLRYNKTENEKRKTHTHV